MDSLGYLFAANAFVWAGIFFYMVTLKNRQQALREDLELLKDIVDKEPKEK